MPPREKRGKNKDNARRSKKKVSILTQERVEYVDWKDVNLLRRFISDRAKIRARRVTGNSAQQQREISLAIKNAREMALIPYTNRVSAVDVPEVVATSVATMPRCVRPLRRRGPTPTATTTSATTPAPTPGRTES
jgi:ribosomal protein S18